MKQIKGYLLDKATGAGISGKAVAFTKLDGSPVTTADTYAQSTSATTAGDGSFYGNFELSPGPVNVTVTAGASEIKKRLNDERAEFGYQWASDISRIARGMGSGIVGGYLNELSVSIPSGHTIRLNTGAAIFNGNVFSVEMGVMDIAGTANTNPALTTRIDLVTIRQYNESAAGQLAGKQQVVVTLGSTSNVAPPTPTGADFVDLPIAEISTAYNASTKTVSKDRRVIVGNGSVAPVVTRKILSAQKFVTTSYTVMDTLNVSGLNPAVVYDGEFRWRGVYSPEAAVSSPTRLGTLMINLTSPYTAGGPHEEPVWTFGIPAGTGVQYYNVFYTIPLVGVTGVSSFNFDVNLKETTAAAGQLPYRWPTSPPYSDANLFEIILRAR